MAPVPTQITNKTFNEDIEEIVQSLTCVRGLCFTKDHIIEDVLQNPGPKEENIDSILRDELNVTTVLDRMCSEEGFLDEEGITEVADVPVHPKNQTRTIYEKVHNTCTRIQGLKFDELTAEMAPHHLEE